MAETVTKPTPEDSSEDGQLDAGQVEECAKDEALAPAGGPPPPERDQRTIGSFKRTVCAGFLLYMSNDRKRHPVALLFSTAAVLAAVALRDHIPMT